MQSPLGITVQPSHHLRALMKKELRGLETEGLGHQEPKHSQKHYMFSHLEGKRNSDLEVKGRDHF